MGMLKLFRHTRQKLLNHGRIRKYALYAIGEILLVVVGILLALQINLLSEKRNDKIAEKNYLLSIRDDLISDTINLGEVLDQIRLNFEAAITLINFFDQSQKTSFDTNVIYSSIRLAGFLKHFETNSVTFDDLKSTGNIRVISNQELRKTIASHYTFIESQKNYRSLWQDKVWGDYWSERDDLINNKLNAFWSNSYYQDLIPIALPKAFDVSSEDTKSFVQSLYKIIDITTFRQTVFREIKSRSKELLLQISAEINK